MTETHLSKAKKLVISISKPIGVLFVVISAVGVVSGLLVDGDSIYEKYCQPKLILQFDRSGPVSPDTELNLSYGLPDTGYYSLWNITGDGEVNRILPKPEAGISAIASNQSNNTGERWLKPNKPNSKEEMVLLWTKTNSDHPPRIHYDTEGEFRQYISIHSSYKWVEKIAKIQVR